MKSIFRRHRNPHQNNEQQEKPFFSKIKDREEGPEKTSFFKAGSAGYKGSSIQTKLAIGQPGDVYEQEADAVADSVVNHSPAQPVVQRQEISSVQRTTLATPVEDERLGTAESRMEKDKLIQEKPEIQQMEGEEEEPVQMQEGEEEEVQMQEEEEEPVQMMGKKEEEAPVQKMEKEETVQTQTNGQPGSPTSLGAKLKSSKGKGSPLPAQTRSEMENSFGVDFSKVRIHTDSPSVAMNRQLSAQAFTNEQDIYFNSGKFDPESKAGKHLLAHELTHTMQQGGGEIKREKIGTAFSHLTGSKSSFKKITGTFDGRDFSLFGDGKSIMTVAAQSGRPYSVKEKDAKACGGSTSESYMNNPKYVGITDNGPIPEGEYQFKATQMATFNQAERNKMLLGGTFTDPFGRSLHGGDWGSGRVALAPIKILPGPKGCGNTSARSGFYLHGGIMPGSSGCIDVGNAGFDTVVQQLQGYRGNIVVKVKYTHGAQDVGIIDRALGRFTYPEGENPTVLDRIKSIFSD